MSDPIAARLGDHHLCLQHIGDDLIAPGAPTILIGGAIAARATDLAMCKGGPLDTVTIGEPTVLLTGKMAARFGDGTAHAGLIDEGCPTVIIGKMTAADKRMRYMERLRLIAAAREKAASMPNGAEKDKLSQAAERLAENNKAVEDARLAKDVYNTSGAPEGWHRVTPDELPDSLKDAVFHDDGSGFYSDLYRSEIDGSYRLVFRGTEVETGLQWSGNDWLWGNSQGAGIPATQYTRAVDLARQVDGVYGGNLSYTGHSLGGGLASAAALATGNSANTVNAAGLSPMSDFWYNLDSDQAADLVTAYQTDGDILTVLQEDSPIAGLMPDAVGNRHPLPAVNMTQNADGSYSFSPRPPAPKAPQAEPRKWYDWLNPVDHFNRGKDWLSGQIDEKKAWATEGAARHSNHIEGIESQKAEDTATLQGML